MNVMSVGSKVKYFHGFKDSLKQNKTSACLKFIKAMEYLCYN